MEEGRRFLTWGGAAHPCPTSAVKRSFARSPDSVGPHATGNHASPRTRTSALRFHRGMRPKASGRHCTTSAGHPTQTRLLGTRLRMQMCHRTHGAAPSPGQPTTGNAARAVHFFHATGRASTRLIMGVSGEPAGGPPSQCPLARSFSISAVLWPRAWFVTTPAHGS